MFLLYSWNISIDLLLYEPYARDIVCLLMGSIFTSSLQICLTLFEKSSCCQLVLCTHAIAIDLGAKFHYSYKEDDVVSHSTHAAGSAKRQAMLNVHHHYDSESQ